MNTTNKQEQTALTLPERAAVALGESANAAKLRELAAKSASITIVNSADGREEAHRAGMVLRKTRTSIRDTGKAARDDATKFSKAVIAMEDELIALIEPEEKRVIALRDEFDAKVEAERQAAIAKERARMEMHEKLIRDLLETPLKYADCPSGTIGIAIEELQQAAGMRDFQEYADRANTAYAETMWRMNDLHAKAIERERAAAEAKAAAEAEAARIAAERKELAELRAAQAERERLAKIESDRIAAEQAAEAKRLSDLAAQQKADADREQAERDRVAADTKRQLEAQAAQVAADRAALQAEQRRNEDHGPALEMNAQFDAERETERLRLQTIADQQLADAHTPLFDMDDSPTDDDLIELVASSYSLSTLEAINRLHAIDFAAARLALEVAA